MSLKLHLIVEGYGEKECMPELVKRYLKSKKIYNVDVPVKNTQGCNNIKALYKPEMSRGIEYFVRMAVQKRPPDALLIVLDSDGDCLDRKKRGDEPLGVSLLRRAKEVAQGVPVGVVIANRQFEAWLVAAWPQICEKKVAVVKNPQAITLKDTQEAELSPGHAEKLARALGQKYSKTKDQPALAQYLPFAGDVLTHAPSFKRLLRVLDQLVAEAKARNH